MNDIIKFVAKDNNIPLDVAENLVKMQEKIKGLQAINKSWIWVKPGQCRLYIDIWSQNSIEPIAFSVKYWFDAIENKWFYTSDYNQIFCDDNINNMWPKNNFSGAKTRKAFEEFQRVIHG